MLSVSTDQPPVCSDHADDEEADTGDLSAGEAVWGAQPRSAEVSVYDSIRRVSGAGVDNLQSSSDIKFFQFHFLAPPGWQLV